MSDLIDVVDCSSTADTTKGPPSIASERIRDFLKSHLTTDSNNDATTDDESQREAAGSPPPNCAICLGRVTNKCFTDSCMHQFCFSCLLEWSKIKAECPLCKQTFKSIIHNVVSMDKYEEYKVEQRRFANFRNIADSLELILYEHEIISQHRENIHTGLLLPAYLHFERPDRPMARHILPSSTSTNPFGASNFNRFYQLFLNETALTERFARQYSNDIIPSRSNGASWRAYVYQRRLYAMPLLDVTGRTRDITAAFYTANPAQMHRLMPWLNREVLFLMNSFLPISYVMGMLTNFITTHDMTSRQFRCEVNTYFHSYTNHFIHELVNFAQSQFDMIGYDNNVQYRPYYEDHPIEEVETLYHERVVASGASVIVQPTPSTSSYTITDGLSPLIFRQVSQSDPVNLTSVTIDSESSDDEVVFVREQKPPHLRTPVMVELNSDSDSDVQFVAEVLPIKLEGNPNYEHPSLNSQLLSGYSSEEELVELNAMNQPKVTIVSRVKRSSSLPPGMAKRVANSGGEHSRALTVDTASDDDMSNLIVSSSASPSTPLAGGSSFSEQHNAFEPSSISVSDESSRLRVSVNRLSNCSFSSDNVTTPFLRSTSSSPSSDSLFAASNVSTSYDNASTSDDSTSTSSSSSSAPSVENVAINTRSGVQRKRKLTRQKRGTATASTKKRRVASMSVSIVKAKKAEMVLDTDDTSSDSSD